MQDNETLIYTISKGDFNHILSINGFVEPVNTTTLVCPRNIEGIISFLIEDGVFVEAGDTVAIIEVTELQNEYDKILLDLENANAELTKTRANSEMQYALLEAQVKNNEADTKIAQLDSLQLEYATPSQKKIKEMELEKVIIEKKKYEKKLKSLEIIQQSEIKRMELRIQRLANRLQTTKDRLDNLILKSPQKGLATRSKNFLTNTKMLVGDPVWGNMPIIIIPEMSRMKIKIFAPEKDYKAINVNDSVSYHFDAMPDNIAWGKILKKSPVGQQQNQKSKLKYFEIEASIDSVLSMPEPGFTAKCNVFLKQVKDTIVVPQIAVFDEDSIKVVYVKTKSGYEMRQVLQGVSSSKEVIITSGLKENEKISLIKPEASSIKEKTILNELSVIK